MKKVLDLIMWLFRNKIGRIMGIIFITFIVSFSVFVYLDNKESEIDTTYIIAKLEESSELTTTKLNYTGMSEYKDTGISFINKSDFIMVYEATARIGIDVKEIEIESDDFNKVVWITMPTAKILDVKVDLGKIKYFDEKFALFNVDSKEDANKACALAEQDGIKEAEATGILEFAETEAEYVIKDILTPALPEGYTLTVKKAE